MRELSTEPDGVLAAGEMLTDIGAAWGQMTAGERRDAARIILARVAVSLPTREVVGFAPHPDFEPLFDVVAESWTQLENCAWRPRADSDGPHTNLSGVRLAG